MNYIILNGVKSTLIKGLLIQSLPPIAKPLMRTKKEAIDGRDGDIVTKLGYSAYDKEISIGLFGDYDVDEVISYFNTDGKVIFSNEPDKFYIYEMIEQIDFEKLIRFKTATVKFHCQPFKFSAVDDEFIISKNKIHARPYSTAHNGIHLTVENGVIGVEGVASATTEIYVPIDEMYLKGSYTFQADVDGDGANGCNIRVIDDLPTDADSFGNRAFQLSSSVEYTATISETKVFKYIWIQFARGHAVDFDLYVQMFDNQFNSVKVLNRGNTISRPTLTIYGTGTIDLAINGTEVFEINLASAGYITLNAQEMNAYKGDVLMNRSVLGDFNNLVLKSGINQISWTGNVTQISIENVSRWI